MAITWSFTEKGISLSLSVSSALLGAPFLPTMWLMVSQRSRGMPPACVTPVPFGTHMWLSGEMAIQFSLLAYFSLRPRQVPSQCRMDWDDSFLAVLRTPQTFWLIYS